MIYLFPLEESSTQELTPQAAPATRVNKPWVHNVLARLTQLVGIYFPTLKDMIGYMACVLILFCFAESITKSSSLRSSFISSQDHFIS
jgi:hypothetical protein